MQGCAPFCVGDGGGRFLHCARNDRGGVGGMTGKRRILAER